MTISEQAGRAEKRAQRAREISAHLQKLLSERDPEFLAALRAAERQVDLELSRAAAGCPQEAAKP